MNILHISTPHFWRGGEQQLSYLATEIREQVNKQLFLCTERGALEAFCFDHGFTSFPMKPGIINHYANANLLKRICKNYNIDIIHTHDSKAHTIAFIASLMGNKTPIVVGRKVDFPIGKNRLSIKKYNHPTVAKIICVSEKIKEVTGAAIKDKSKLTVIYDGVSTDMVGHEQRVDIYKEFGVPKGKKIIGNIAALAPHKDYFTWIDTAEILLEKRQDLHFLIVGDGPLRGEITSYIQKKDLEAHITMTGFREDAKAIISSLDVFFISSMTEGLGSSTLDAFVRGAPVTATAAGGIPEIVHHEETGLLAPVKNSVALANQIERLLDDPEFAHRLAEQARCFVKDFDKKLMAEKTLKVYKEIVRESLPNKKGALQRH